MSRAEPLRHHFDDLDQQHHAAALGMWAFLATEVLFFGAPLLVYLVTRFLHPEAFATASARLDGWLGAINTAVLLTSSAAMARADDLGERDDAGSAVRWLAATACFGVAFLGIKAYEYHAEYTEGLLAFRPAEAEPLASAAERLFFNVYLTLTGLHAIHLTIGIGLVAAAAWACRRRAPAAPAMRLRVTALYWHFVDVVWLFLFPLLYLVS